MAESAREGLKLAAKYEFAAAFLDIQMAEENGLEMAVKLQDRNPEINLIFVTAYEEYAYMASALHFSGYLTKPASVASIMKELRHLRYPIGIPEETPLTKGLWAQCFGSFEVYMDGRPIHFRRTKTKELMALLIDRRGASATVDEICAAIFEDFGMDSRHRNSLRVLAMELRQLLESCGLEAAYVHKRNAYALRFEMIPSDLMRYLAGEKNLYQGKYMEQYGYWAWFRFEDHNEGVPDTGKKEKTQDKKPEKDVDKQ